MDELTKLKISSVDEHKDLTTVSNTDHEGEVDSVVETTENEDSVSAAELSDEGSSAADWTTCTSTDDVGDDSTPSVDDPTLPVEIFANILSRLPHATLFQCLTVNSLFYDIASRCLFRHLNLFKGRGLPPVHGDYTKLLDCTRTVDIFPHAKGQCDAEKLVWDASGSMVHSVMLRIFYEDVISNFVLGGIGCLPLHTFHNCKFLTNIHANCIVLRNFTMSFDIHPDLGQSDIDASSITDPGCCAKQIVQILLPNHLHGDVPSQDDILGFYEFMPMAAQLAKVQRPVDNCMWVFWTPGPGVKWPLGEDVSENWLRLQPLLHMMQHSSASLTIINADAILDPPDGPCGCKTPHWCHGFLPYLNDLIEKLPASHPDAPDFRKLMENITFASMTEFILHSPWENIFTREEISGWLELIENGTEEDGHGEPTEHGSHNHGHHHDNGRDGDNGGSHGDNNDDGAHDDDKPTAPQDIDTEA